MNFANYLLFLADFVRLVALKPLHPFGPHLVDFVLLELSSYAESSDCVDIRIELASMFQVGEFGIEYLYDLFLLGFNLGQFTVGYPYWILTLHLIMPINYILLVKSYQKTSCYIIF